MFMIEISLTMNSIFDNSVKEQFASIEIVNRIV